MREITNGLNYEEEIHVFTNETDALTFVRQKAYITCAVKLKTTEA
jgi:hypothetical protein